LDRSVPLPAANRFMIRLIKTFSVPYQIMMNRFVPDYASTTVMGRPDSSDSVPESLDMHRIGMIDWTNVLNRDDAWVRP
jgi:hypothetical protein